MNPGYSFHMVGRGSNRAARAGLASFLLFLLLFLLMGTAAADLEVVSSTELLPTISDSDRGYPGLIQIRINETGGSAVHLRVQLRSSGKVVSRMWNGSAWVYPWTFSDCLRCPLTDGLWEGDVFVRLWNYTNYPQAEAAGVVEAKIEYRVDGSDENRGLTQYDIDLYNVSEAGTISGTAYSGGHIPHAIYEIEHPNGTMLYRTEDNGCSEDDGPSPLPPDGWFRYPVPAGNCTFSLFHDDSTIRTEVVAVSTGKVTEIEFERPVLPRVLFSEVVFDPYYLDHDHEWFELRNLGNETVDLDGWMITDLDSFEHTITNLTMEAGECALFVFTDDEGPYTSLGDMNALANSGDDLHLLDEHSWIVDYVGFGDAVKTDPPLYGHQWGDAGPVPIPPDGYGLRRVNAASISVPTNWAPVAEADLTPGYSLTDLRNALVNGTDHRPMLLISEVRYDGTADDDEDEWITVYNPGNNTVDLFGWQLTDHESSFWFHPGDFLGPYEHLSVTRNSTLFEHLTGTNPGALMNGSVHNVSEHSGLTHAPEDRSYSWMHLLSSTFGMRADPILLSNSGDEVSLRYGQLPIDAIAYDGSDLDLPGWIGGPIPGLSAGRILYRSPAGNDTNTSLEWNHLIERLPGQTGSRPIDFRGDAILFTSPESSHDLLIDMFTNAEERILIELYQLTSPSIGTALINASERGVDVRILLEGAPVSWSFGNVSEDEYIINGHRYQEAYSEKYLAEQIVDAGGKVRFMRSDVNRTRYLFIHAKHAIVDDGVLVMTENWKDSGCPPVNTMGNRGWGAVIHSDELADTAADVFFRTWSVRYDLTSFGQWPYTPVPEYFRDEWDRTRSGNGSSSIYGNYRPIGESTSISDVKGTLVYAPDSNLDQGTLIGAIEDATETILIELLSLPWNWSSGGDGEPNRYLEAVKDAALNGVKVRVLLDSRYSDPGSYDWDNYDTVVALNHWANESSVDLEAKLADLDGLSKVHNKGMIIDSRIVMVSSLNWGRSASTNNREHSLLIDDPRAAAFFERYFYHDWNLTLLSTFDVTGINGTFRNWSVSVMPVEIEVLRSLKAAGEILLEITSPTFGLPKGVNLTIGPMAAGEILNINFSILPKVNGTHQVSVHLTFDGMTMAYGPFTIDVAPAYSNGGGGNGNGGNGKDGGDGSSSSSSHLYGPMGSAAVMVVIVLLLLFRIKRR